ncbi:NemA protein [Neisseria sp.]|uniref:NemA protein n=1 Tax=Neisseria sp. TaxID=192066 RepID=UPI0035A0F9ED
MKIGFVAAGMAVWLAGCAGGTPGMSVGLGLGTGIGSHVGLGTSINIPVGGRKINPDRAGILNGQHPAVYFDAQGNAADQAVRGGFYRQVLSRRSGEAVVQDFYGSGQKRTDPYTVAEGRLKVFDAHPDDGTLTVYTISGKPMRTETFRNGRAVVQ